MEETKPSKGFTASFRVPGGFDKAFYTRYRPLQKKCKLTDMGLIECILWYTLRSLPKTVKP
jgi:hypothetical protein